MSAPGAGANGGGLRRWRASRVRLACGVCVGVFLWAVAQFYDPTTGFTSLIKIGDEISGRQVAVLRQVPHFVYEDSAGYDGAWYVQLALHPTLDNPELKKAIDNLPYRARRMLFSWTAWLLGLGQPAWTVQAFALINVGAWLALAWVLLRWFPPTGWENFLRWFAVMFSHGLCMSVRDSLVDGPSLLLVALAMAWLEDGRRARGAAMLALAGLGKETSLLAVTALAEPSAGRGQASFRFRQGYSEPPARPDWRSARTWWRFARTAALVALPVLAWMGFIRWKFGPAGETGLNNFTLPFAGLAEKWGASLAALAQRGESTLRWATLGLTLGLTVQFLFFALRWRPHERWWRVGATFALLLMFLATPVWEGLPGAAARALLPMTLAFNILVPRGRRWLAVLIAGNLTVAAAYREFDPPSHDFFQVSGESALVAAVHVAPIGWYGPENRDDLHWRWSAGQSDVRLQNQAGRPIAVVVSGRAAAAGVTKLGILVGGAAVWSGEATAKPVDFQFGFVLPPGETTVRFVSEQPGRITGTDARKLAFDIFNLEVVLTPKPGQ